MSRRIFQRLWLAPLLFCAALGAWAQTSARMPCETLSQYKQFDFWIGEWEVTAEGRKVADSSIQRIVSGCVIYENYTQPDGYLGKSFNNLGFLVEIGGRKLLHIGDAEATAADLATYELPKEAIDIAFVPYWYFLQRN